MTNKRSGSNPAGSRPPKDSTRVYVQPSFPTYDWLNSTDHAVVVLVLALVISNPRAVIPAYFLCYLLFAICYSASRPGIIVAVNGLRLEQSGLTWNHEAHGSFIRAECADVSLLFDSCAGRWTLRIYKRQTSFGHPVTYEIAFKERYGPTVEQAIALANNILLVELQ
jgi:hypothetical protein